MDLGRDPQIELPKIQWCLVWRYIRHFCTFPFRRVLSLVLNPRYCYKDMYLLPLNKMSGVGPHQQIFILDEKLLLAIIDKCLLYSLIVILIDFPIKLV